MVFKPAVKAKAMKLWVSAAFAEQHSVVHEIITAAMELPGTKWSWFVGSNVEFLRGALKYKSLCGLVTNREFDGFPRDFVNCLTGPMFLDTLCTVCPSSQTAESRGRVSA